MSACLVCGVNKVDSQGNPAHEPWCVQFMQGPDAGGDPRDWDCLFDVAALEAHSPSGEMRARDHA